MLRSRRGRREQPLADVTVEPPAGEASDPEAQALLADSVGPALMVVLDTLASAVSSVTCASSTQHRGCPQDRSAQAPSARRSRTSPR
jgi:hypothetical protein